MKLRKLMAALTAAAAAIVPLTAADTYVPALSSVFAKEEADTGKIITDWIPSDYESALSFRNNYGAVHIGDGLLCIVFDEHNSIRFADENETQMIDRYIVKTTEGVMKLIGHEKYSSEKAETAYEVLVYKPEKKGNFEAALVDTWLKSSELDLGYNHAVEHFTFSVDRNMNITETDIYGWLPDCVLEYREFLTKNGKLSTKNNYVIFCLDSSAGTAYDWYDNSPEYSDIFKTIAISSCNKETETALSGGAVHTIIVYKAISDGCAKITMKLGNIYGGSDEVIDSITADCAVTDNANAVLMPDETRFTVINGNTGLPVPDEYLKEKQFYVVADIRYRRDDMPGGWMFTGPIYNIPENGYIINEDLVKHYKDADIFKILPMGNDDSSTKIKLNDNGSLNVEMTVYIDACGDINNDGEFNISDLVTFQQWLLGAPDTNISNWWNIDFCADGKLNAYDMIGMREALTSYAPSVKK